MIRKCASALHYTCIVCLVFYTWDDRPGDARRNAGEPERRMAVNLSDFKENKSGFSFFRNIFQYTFNENLFSSFLVAVKLRTDGRRIFIEIPKGCKHV